MRPWPAPSASHQAGTTGPDAPSKLVTAGATSGPHLTGLLRTTLANNGQASSLVNAAIEAAAQVATTARRSLARRKSPEPRSALGLCRNGHARASAVTNVTCAQAAGRPPSGSSNRDAASSKSACGPEVVDREVPGSAAENRWEKRTYLLLRKLRSRLDRATAPNTPTRLHIAPQPDQETAQPSQFARRSRFVETPAFLTGPQSHRGEAS